MYNNQKSKVSLLSSKTFFSKKIKYKAFDIYIYVYILSAFLPEVSPCGWTDWAVWASLDVLAHVPAFSGLRDGSDLGLILEVFDEMDVKG